MCTCVCVCVCVCARARVCVCVCVWHTISLREWLFLPPCNVLHVLPRSVSGCCLPGLVLLAVIVPTPPTSLAPLVYHRFVFPDPYVCSEESSFYSVSCSNTQVNLVLNSTLHRLVTMSRVPLRGFQNVAPSVGKLELSYIHIMLSGWGVVHLSCMTLITPA